MAKRTGKRAVRAARAEVGEPPPAPYGEAPGVARVFQSGNSQAVRLPKQFRLRSKQVQVFRRGADIVLRERPPTFGDLLAELPPLPDDALPDQIPDHLPEPVEID